MRADTHSRPAENRAVRLAVFNTRPHDHQFLQPVFESLGIEVSYFEARLQSQTVSLAQGHNAVCAFVNDELNAQVIDALEKIGCRLIALRCAGFNNVDIEAAGRHSITVVRVPEYSPQAVAEHTFGLILSVNRKIHKAFNRVREGNFSLDGLLGFDLHGRTLGIVGTGRIGACVAKIAGGFGCRLKFFDPQPDNALMSIGDYVEIDELWQTCDMVTLHCPLNSHTYHLVDEVAVAKLKDQVMLINTSRGGLIDTSAIIQGLKSGKIGSLGLDVYEEEASLFFADHSLSVVQDDVFMRLLTFPNVLITGHQGFFTEDALRQIASTTGKSIDAWSQGNPFPTGAVVVEPE